MKFTSLKKGQLAKIAGFDNRKGQFNIPRLLALGLTPGTQIKIIRVSPLGSPLHVKVGSSEFCLRREEAQHILVEAV